RPASWTPGALAGTAIASGLPSAQLRALAVDRLNPHVVYAATANGVWRGASSDGGTTFAWDLYSNGMPPAANVTDLEVHPSTGSLRAATFGQGIYEVIPDRSSRTVSVTKQSLCNGATGSVSSNPAGITCGA